MFVEYRIFQFADRLCIEILQSSRKLYPALFIQTQHSQQALDHNFP